jgi:hypothetical protein
LRLALQNNSNKCCWNTHAVLSITVSKVRISNNFRFRVVNLTYYNENINFALAGGRKNRRIKKELLKGCQSDYEKILNSN